MLYKFMPIFMYLYVFYNLSHYKKAVFCIHSYVNNGVAKILLAVKGWFEFLRPTKQIGNFSEIFRHMNYYGKKSAQRFENPLGFLSKPAGCSHFYTVMVIYET